MLKAQCEEKARVVFTRYVEQPLLLCFRQKKCQDKIFIFIHFTELGVLAIVTSSAKISLTYPH